jgi:hypothetical protein
MGFCLHDAVSKLVDPNSGSARPGLDILLHRPSRHCSQPWQARLLLIPLHKLRRQPNGTHGGTGAMGVDSAGGRVDCFLVIVRFLMIWPEEELKGLVQRSRSRSVGQGWPSPGSYPSSKEGRTILRAIDKRKDEHQEEHKRCSISDQVSCSFPIRHR